MNLVHWFRKTSGDFLFRLSRGHDELFLRSLELGIPCDIILQLRDVLTEMLYNPGLRCLWQPFQHLDHCGNGWRSHSRPQVLRCWQRPLQLKVGYRD